MPLISSEDKIFVAGHRGMVGSSIKRSLKAKGYTNILTVNKKELDLTDQNSVKNWFSNNKPNVVAIAAAKVGGIYANDTYPTDFLLDNLKIQNNLIQNSFEFGVKRLLFLGSSCIYPKFAKQPLKEEYLMTGELETTNEWYAIAKIAGIKLCDAYRIQYDFDAISLMPTNLYGPGDNYHHTNSHVMPALIRKFHTAILENEKKVICWGTGKPLREFLHVNDLGDACVFALEKWNPNNPTSPKDSRGNPSTFLNVGTGIDITIKALAECIADLVGFKGEIEWDDTKPDGTPKKQLDVSKIKSLGWESKIGLKEGIKNTILEYKEYLKNKKLRT